MKIPTSTSRPSLEGKIIAIIAMPAFMSCTFYSMYQILMIPFDHPELNWASDVSWAFLLLSCMSICFLGLFSMRWVINKVLDSWFTENNTEIKEG